MQEIRCTKCNKKLGLINGVYEIQCPRCGYLNKGGVVEKKEGLEGYKIIKPSDLLEIHKNTK